MCDYSLGGLPNRLAVEGEELVLFRFRSGSIGMAPKTECIVRKQPVEAGAGQQLWNWLKTTFTMAPRVAPVAVCVPPGAQLMLHGVPDYLQKRWKVNETEAVTFTQISANEFSYRDSVRFNNGVEALLQTLREGMTARVLSLGESPVGTEELVLRSALR